MQTPSLASTPELSVTTPHAVHKIVNLTPHDGHIVLPSGACTLLKSDHPVSIEFERSIPSSLTWEGAEIPFWELDEPVSPNLPEPESGTYYLVSAVVAAFNSDRADLVIVHDYIRDDRGAVKGCRGLARAFGPPRSAPPEI